MSAHAFRDIVLPPLQAGLRRNSMDFLVDEIGLNVEYTIIDKEVHYSPPKPATTWNFE